MKVRTIITRSFLLSIIVTVSMMITSCADEIVMQDPEFNNGLNIEVTEDNGNTRAAFSFPSVNFETGDKIGVYCCNGTTILFSNICFTRNGSGQWTTSSHIEYNENYTYYAYYPYVASPYTPNFTQSQINDKFSLFLTDASNKFHRDNQSTKANFNACDLMIAQGVDVGSKTIKFTLAHKKGLLKITGSIPSGLVSSKIPYVVDGNKYYLIKPSSNQEFAGENHYLSPGNYKSYEYDAPLTFTALESGTFTLKICASVNTDNYDWVEYSTNDGASWTRTNNTSSDVTITTPTIAAGGRVLWRGSGQRMGVGEGEDQCSYFRSTGRFAASGNVMSLTSYDSYRTTKGTNGFHFLRLFWGCSTLTTAPRIPVEMINYYACFCMFDGSGITAPPELPAVSVGDNGCRFMFNNCTSMTTAPNLPATSIGENGYWSMFEGCTALTAGPVISATRLPTRSCRYMFKNCTSMVSPPSFSPTTVGNYSCEYMFANCTSLTSVPNLSATTMAEGCFKYMFQGCSSLTTVRVLPATTLAEQCYEQMFKDCTALVTVPSNMLPATTLRNYCYKDMFNNCTSLTSVPNLPATTMATSCYYAMFKGCTSLTTVRVLPATTLADYCYEEMFRGCTALVTVPSNMLPATTLSRYCYRYLFADCTSFTTAPVLPASTLVECCYRQLFEGCSSLSYIKMMATDISANECLAYWTRWLPSSGTFVRHVNNTSMGVHDWGIPPGWTVQTATN